MLPFLVKPFCKPGQTTVYGVAKWEKIHVSCEVVANPEDNIYFNWVFNSSSERLDLQENLIRNEVSKSIAEHTPQVKTYRRRWNLEITFPLWFQIKKEPFFPRLWGYWVEFISNYLSSEWSETKQFLPWWYPYWTFLFARLVENL